jgi:hypothetical protein
MLERYKASGQTLPSQEKRIRAKPKSSKTSIKFYSSISKI